MFVTVKWQGNRAVGWYFVNKEGTAGPGYAGNSPNELCGKCGDLISVHKCDNKGTECQFSDEEECTEHWQFPK